MTVSKLQLNDFQRNSLEAGFKYIDRLLTEAVGGLTPAEDGAIFAPLAPDTTLIQRKIISDQAGRIRRAMRLALDACSILVEPPTISALRNLRCALTFIDITIEELGPKHLCGYGTIDDDTAQEVQVIQAKIRAALAELSNYIASGLGGDLTARLNRLDHTRDEVRLLLELARIVTAHGLVELRLALSLLLERLETNLWTVAYVGRVSCGKSSLLNYLLGTDILPSGVTPVTAVPVRIIPGLEPIASVSFALGKTTRVPGAQIGEFVSEEHNPCNCRHVTDVLLEMPAERLSGDVCFVDTPGLGSLATDGAAQTLGFLPRCDLGVFLLDCASSLTGEDLRVIRTLFENGAEVLVVLSKADLLTTGDREKMRAYVARQLAAEFSREVPVSAVSVTAAQSALTENWYDDMMAPRQADHRQLAVQALRRKVGSLKETVTAALIQRTGLARGNSSSATSVASIGAVQAMLEGRRREIFDLVYREMPSAKTAIDEVVDLLPQEAFSQRDGDPPQMLAGGFVRVVARLGDASERLLNETRGAVVGTLKEMGKGGEVLLLQPPSSRPLFDPSAIVAVIGVSTRWRRWPTALIKRAILRRHLHNRAATALEDSLRAYGAALIAWGQRYFDEVRRQFNAEIGLAEAVTSENGSATPSQELLRDLELLRTWNVPAEATP